VASIGRGYKTLDRYMKDEDERNADRLAAMKRIHNAPTPEVQANRKEAGLE